MTFVAQPYERFVDDLLIALTGGAIREEHEFTGVDRAYSLGSPDAIADSLRVFGQRGGEFALFEQGIDYRYDATEDGIAWLLEGAPPDDRTHFYVSYFTGDGGGRITDRNPGSVTTTLAEAFARQYGVLHKEMRLIYESAFVDLATGSALDHVAALLDVTRKDAKFASGEVLFKRSTPAPGDISVAVGTLVATQEGQVFETTAPRTLRRDQLSVVLPVRAQQEGLAGAVAADAIALINRPIFGIESVTNERATFFATERETDEELRRRIRGRIHRAGRSTLEAIRTGLIDEVEELTEANVQVAERPEAPGAVEVRLGVADGLHEELVRRVDGAILDSRPAGVRVRHNLSTAAPAEPPPPVDRGRAEVVADLQALGAPERTEALGGDGGGPDTVLPLRVEVLIRLTEPNLTASEREAIEEKVRSTIVGYVDALPIGAPLVYAKLLGRVAGADEVADATMLVGPADPGASPSYRVNVVAEGRKLTVTADEVAVHLMDQRVQLDVRVPVQEAEGASGPQVTGQLVSAVTASIERALAGAATITREAIREAAAQALAGPTGFILADAVPVVVNASYEETGRLLSDLATLELAEHELVVLRTVEVEPIGVLDG
jgi:Baseplate J-like protein